MTDSAGYLVFKKNGGMSKSFELEKGECNIGSSVDNDIRFICEHPLLQEKHALIDVNSNGVATIISKYEKSPVTVNGKVVRKRILMHQDKIEIVGIVFQYFNKTLSDEPKKSENSVEVQENVQAKVSSINPASKPPVFKTNLLHRKSFSEVKLRISTSRAKILNRKSLTETKSRIPIPIKAVHLAASKNIASKKFLLDQDSSQQTNILDRSSQEISSPVRRFSTRKSVPPRCRYLVTSSQISSPRKIQKNKSLGTNQTKSNGKFEQGVSNKASEDTSFSAKRLSPRKSINRSSIRRSSPKMNSKNKSSNDFSLTSFSPFKTLIGNSTTNLKVVGRENILDFQPAEPIEKPQQDIRLFDNITQDTSPVKRLSVRKSIDQSVRSSIRKSSQLISQKTSNSNKSLILSKDEFQLEKLTDTVRRLSTRKSVTTSLCHSVRSSIRKSSHKIWQKNQNSSNLSSISVDIHSNSTKNSSNGNSQELALKVQQERQTDISEDVDIFDRTSQNVDPSSAKSSCNSSSKKTTNESQYLSVLDDNLDETFSPIKSLSARKSITAPLSESVRFSPTIEQENIVNKKLLLDQDSSQQSNILNRSSQEISSPVRRFSTRKSVPPRRRQFFTSSGDICPRRKIQKNKSLGTNQTESNSKLEQRVSNKASHDTSFSAKRLSPRKSINRSSIRRSSPRMNPKNKSLNDFSLTSFSSFNTLIGNSTIDSKVVDKENILDFQPTECNSSSENRTTDKSQYLSVFDDNLDETFSPVKSLSSRKSITAPRSESVRFSPTIEQENIVSKKLLLDQDSSQQSNILNRSSQEISSPVRRFSTRKSVPPRRRQFFTSSGDICPPRKIQKNKSLGTNQTESNGKLEQRVSNKASHDTSFSAKRLSPRKSINRSSIRRSSPRMNPKNKSLNDFSLTSFSSFNTLIGNSTIDSKVVDKEDILDFQPAEFNSSNEKTTINKSQYLSVFDDNLDETFSPVKSLSSRKSITTPISESIRFSPTSNQENQSLKEHCSVTFDTHSNSRKSASVPIYKKSLQDLVDQNSDDTLIALNIDSDSSKHSSSGFSEKPTLGIQQEKVNDISQHLAISADKAHEVLSPFKCSSFKQSVTISLDQSVRRSSQKMSRKKRNSTSNENNEGSISIEQGNRSSTFDDNTHEIPSPVDRLSSRKSLSTPLGQLVHPYPLRSSKKMSMVDQNSDNSSSISLDIVLNLSSPKDITPQVTDTNAQGILSPVRRLSSRKSISTPRSQFTNPLVRQSSSSKRRQKTRNSNEQTLMNIQPEIPLHSLGEQVRSSPRRLSSKINVINRNSSGIMGEVLPPDTLLSARNSMTIPLKQSARSSPQTYSQRISLKNQNLNNSSPISLGIDSDTAENLLRDNNEKNTSDIQQGKIADISQHLNKFDCNTRKILSPIKRLSARKCVRTPDDPSSQGLNLKNQSSNSLTSCHMDANANLDLTKKSLSNKEKPTLHMQEKNSTEHINIIDGSPKEILLPVRRLSNRKSFISPIDQSRKSLNRKSLTATQIKQNSNYSFLTSFNVDSSSNSVRSASVNSNVDIQEEGPSDRPQHFTIFDNTHEVLSPVEHLSPKKSPTIFIRQSSSRAEKSTSNKRNTNNEAEIDVSICPTGIEPEAKNSVNNIVEDFSGQNSKLRRSKRKTSLIFHDVSCTSTPFYKRNPIKGSFTSKGSTEDNVKTSEINNISSDSSKDKTKSTDNIALRKSSLRNRKFSDGEAPNCTLSYSPSPKRNSLEISKEHKLSKQTDSSEKSKLPKSSNKSGNSIIHRVSNHIDTMPEKAQEIEGETPKSAIKTSHQGIYNLVIEDIIPVTPEKLMVSDCTEKNFKTPVNTPGLFESIRGNVIRSRKRRRETSGYTLNIKKPKTDILSEEDRRKIEASATQHEGFPKENFIKDTNNISGDTCNQKQIGNSPNNDLTNVTGVKRIFEKSPKNDLTKVPNLKNFFSPKKPKSPKNDLTNVRGIKKLLQTPKESTNNLSDVSGIGDIFIVSDIDVPHKGIDTENSGDFFSELSGKKPLKCYRKGKSSSPVKDDLNDNLVERKSMDSLPEYSPRVQQWVNDHHNVIYSPENGAILNYKENTSNVIEYPARKIRGRKGISTRKTTQENILNDSPNIFKQKVYQEIMPNDHSKIGHYSEKGKILQDDILFNSSEKPKTNKKIKRKELMVKTQNNTYMPNLSEAEALTKDRARKHSNLRQKVSDVGIQNSKEFAVNVKIPTRSGRKKIVALSGNSQDLNENEITTNVKKLTSKNTRKKNKNQFEDKDLQITNNTNAKQGNIVQKMTLRSRHKKVETKNSENERKNKNEDDYAGKSSLGMKNIIDHSTSLTRSRHTVENKTSVAKLRVKTSALTIKIRKNNKIQREKNSDYKITSSARSRCRRIKTQHEHIEDLNENVTPRNEVNVEISSKTIGGKKDKISYENTDHVLKDSIENPDENLAPLVKISIKITRSKTKREKEHTEENNDSQITKNTTTKKRNVLHEHAQIHISSNKRRKHCDIPLDRSDIIQETNNTKASTYNAIQGPITRSRSKMMENETSVAEVNMRTDIFKNKKRENKNWHDKNKILE